MVNIAGKFTKLNIIFEKSQFFPKEKLYIRVESITIVIFIRGEYQWRFSKTVNLKQ